MMSRLAQLVFSGPDLVPYQLETLKSSCLPSCASIFWPDFSPKSQKHSKLNSPGAKRIKEIGKFRNFIENLGPQNPHEPKDTPKIGVGDLDSIAISVFVILLVELTY